MTSRGHKTEAWNSVRPRGPHAELGPLPSLTRRESSPNPKTGQSDRTPLLGSPGFPRLPCAFSFTASWLSGRSRGQEILQEAGVVLSTPAQGAHTCMYTVSWCAYAPAPACARPDSTPPRAAAGAPSAQRYVSEVLTWVSSVISGLGCGSCGKKGENAREPWAN